MLTFFSRSYEIETSWDKGEVQISTDGGTVWQRVPVAYPGTSTNTSDNCGLPTGSYFTGEGTGYAGYGADLSAWGNTNVLLRFVLSTDGSVVDNGWWVDDISITNVDVPGVCTTGSACAENPLVNVLPDGPLNVCLGQQQQLSANLTGGTGPFLYQWTRDGIDIPGADQPTLDVDDVGEHVYNVDVRSTSCADDARDGAPTTIDWESKPAFAGIESATNAQSSTCGVDLTWSAAASVCPGPLTYDVYRSLSTPVPVTPGNRVASGVGGLSYNDANGLISGQTYNYLVRAVEGSTGEDDGNVVEDAAAPTGPGGGVQTVFTEDFESAAAFGDWSVTTGPGSHTCGDWDRSNNGEERPVGGSGFYALTNSDTCGSGSQTSTDLESPSIDLAIPGIQSVILEHDIYYNHYNGDDSTIEVWDGSSWQTIWSDNDEDIDLHQIFDVTIYAAGNPDFRVRYRYQNASYDWWFAVDNVEVTVDVANECATGGPTAAVPAPDGSATTQPLRGSRLTPAGDTIEVTWDTLSCPSFGYNLLYGDLIDVPSYALTGAECAIGTAGTHTWSAVPAGDLYFLVVGNDGGSTESSWGADSSGGQRGGPFASGECGAVTKDLTETCP